MNSESDIEAIRRALALTAADEAYVQEAAPQLVKETDRWVESFYARLSADPAAVALLHDEGTVVRVKRLLGAWFQEVLSLPYDAGYERTRAEIGRVHVRIGMPQHLMVTAMTGIRRDVRASVLRVFADDASRAAQTADALDKVLDMELALMLDAYRRRAREIEQRTDRALIARSAESRGAHARTDAADATACYALLLRRAKSPETADRWASLLAKSLDAVVHLPARARVDVSLADVPKPAAVAQVCARALEQVSVPSRTDVETLVAPPDARIVVHETLLCLAIEELLQNALNRDPGGAVRLVATALADGALFVEVSDGGCRWPEGIRSVEDAVVAGGGLSVVHCELVADLHGGSIELMRPAGGGGGVRLRLPPIAAAAAVPVS